MVAELAHIIEAEIRARRLPLAQDCAWQDEMIWPHYSGLSIANVPTTLARVLGCALPGAAPPLDARLLDPATQVERVVLVLLDGFGYNLLQELCAEPDFAQMVDDVVGDGALAPLTSVFPSTTVAALSTLWTGFPPAGHAMLGTRLLMREFGAMVNMLSLSPLASKGFQELLAWGFDPDKALGVPGIAERLAGADVRTRLATMSNLAGSGLSNLLHRGVGQVHRLGSFVDLWAVMEEVMETTRRERCLIAVYWGALDYVSHYAGARSRRALVEAREEFLRLRDFVGRCATGDGRTLLIALADHGHINYREGDKIKTADHPALADTFRMPPAGEAGASYLFLRTGMREQAERYLRERLSDKLVALDSQAALEAGLFGDGARHPETAARVGDLVVVCREGARLSDPFDYFPFFSGHGALSAGEMLVPVIVRLL